MNTRLSLCAACAGTLLLFASIPASAQLVNWTNASTGFWNEGGNWSGPFGNEVPDAQFGESANISNGGTATFSGGPSVGGVILGQNAGQSGTLIVQTGSAMSVVAEAGTNGAVVVGQAGSGTLTLNSGGSISAVSLTAGGGTASSIRLIGPSANFSPASATLLGNNTLISEISSTAFTPLTVATNAALGGAYRVEFSGGYTPVADNSWTIIDAATVSGSFANFDTSGVPALPAGQRLILATRSGGLGTLVELRVEQLLQLNINRGTNAVSISNAIGGQPVAIDGYTIASNAGSLSVSGWNSFDEQNVPTWIEANPSSSRLSEVRSSGTTTVSGGVSLPIGTAYLAASPSFGVPIEDLTFQYSKADGSLVDGIVNFAGGVQKFNNLVLEINPSGTAQIINDSVHSVAIEGYTITSGDGSLLASNGNWNSFDDQNAAGGDWLEANGSVSRLSEIKVDGVTTFNSTNGINIGHIFNTGGSQSGLTFEFLIAGQSNPFAGAVVFRSHSTSTPIGSGGVPGDYNDNGIVDAADYVVWRKLTGTGALLPNDPSPGVGSDDYTRWRTNFGQTGGSGSGAFVAVPEPAACLLLAAMMPALCLAVRTRRPLQ